MGAPAWWPRRSRRSGREDERARWTLARRFTLRYLAAVVLGLVLVFVYWNSVDRTLSEVEQRSNELAAASGQPTRVTRMVGLVGDLSAAADRGDERALQATAGRLQQEAAALRHVQEGLLQGDRQLGLDGNPLSPQLFELYLGSGRLDQRVVAFASTAELLAGFTGPGDERNRVEPARTMLEEQEELIADLEQAIQIYTAEIDALIAGQRRTDQLLLWSSLFVGAFMVGLLFVPMARQINRETTQLEEAERIHRQNNERQTFRNDLARALEVCQSEDEVLHAGGRALHEVIPTNPAELLLVDSTNTRLAAGIVHPDAGPAGCPVDEPQACAALRAGQAQVYESSRMLNVCPKLTDRPSGPCSAVCVPLVFNGQALGVLHATGPEHRPVDSTRADRLKVLAHETGNRLGTLRITQATERLARRDALTDLDNRRTLLEQVARIYEAQRPFSVAMADLDHFKDLNDTYGHETGDRALQLFASVLRKHLRPEDLIARFGGEEFVVVLPETPIRDAVRAIERLQVALTEEIDARKSVPFTASWGLTDSSSGQTFEETLGVADLAMYDAKRSGRNCLVVDGAAAERQDALDAVEPASSDGAGTKGESAAVEEVREGSGPA